MLLKKLENTLLIKLKQNPPPKKKKKKKKIGKNNAESVTLSIDALVAGNEMTTRNLNEIDTL